MAHPTNVTNKERIISEVRITSTDAIGLIAHPASKVRAGADRDRATCSLSHSNDRLARVEQPIFIGIDKDDPSGLPDPAQIRRAVRAGRSTDHYPNPALDRLGTGQIERGDQLVGLGNDPIVENHVLERRHPDRQQDCCNRHGDDQFGQGKTSVSVHDGRNQSKFVFFVPAWERIIAFLIHSIPGNPMCSELPPLLATDAPTGPRAASRLDTSSESEPQAPIIKPALIGCVFRECGLRVDELPAAAYATYLEDL